MQLITQKKKIKSFTLVWIGYFSLKGTRRQVSIPSAALQQDYWRDLVEQRRQTTGAGQQMVGRRIARRVGGARLILGGASQARRRLYFLYGRLSFLALLLFCVYVLYCTHTRGENVCKGGLAAGITARASIIHQGGLHHTAIKIKSSFNMSHLFGLNWSVNLSSLSLDMIYKPLSSFH